MSKQLLNTPSKHPFSISALADNAWNRAAEAALSAGWGPITRFAEAAVIAIMQNITTGHLRVLTFSRIYEFPGVPDTTLDCNNHNNGGTTTAGKLGPRAELRVVNDVFWLRLCTMSDLGFAEAYMYGDVECDDLVSLFHIFLQNKDKLSTLNSTLSYFFTTLPQKITSYRFLNTIGNSRSNISAHYDISNDMFAGFLSEDMTYSCAIFKDLDGDLKVGAPQGEWSGGQGLKRVTHTSSNLPNGHASPCPPNPTNGHASPSPYPDSTHPNPTANPHDELHEAQLRKLTHIIHKAQIRPAQRILEIGSGWGSLAILIAQRFPGTTIDTITLSVEQQTLARERIRAASASASASTVGEGKDEDGLDLEARIRVHLMDYRDMPAEWEGAFDRVVSVEMIEAVGPEFLERYWQVVDWAVKREGGAGVVQVISIPEARYDRYIREIDFIRKWVIFPGGFLPTVTLLLQTMKTGSSGRFVVDSISNIGPHYARTLREWRRRFLDSFETVIVPALKRQYPDVMCGPRGKDEIEVFKRKWIYYYCYCEVGFTTRTLGDHIISFVREGYQDYGCVVNQ